MNEFELVEQWFRKGEIAAQEGYPGKVACPVPIETVEGKWWTRGYASYSRQLRAVDAEASAKQNTLMIRILQFGYATGSITRFDCLRSYIRAYPEQEVEALAAATEFEKGCCYCPEQAEGKAGLTVERMREWLTTYC